MTGRYETLALETPDADLLLVRLDRPAVRNAINTQLARELLELFTGLIAEPGPTRAVILTGSGDKAFCAGADLKERHGMSDEDWQRQHQLIERLMLAIIDCPIPVIAAVNGVAYAGGCELVLCCDFAYAVEGTRFALTEVGIGIMPGGGGTQTLPRAAGLRRAKEIILSAEPFSAADALAWGVVNRLCAPGTLMERTLATARRIAANAPLSVRQAKRAMNFGAQMDQRTGMHFEIDAYNRLVPTADRREGIAAFNEKRKPHFQGR